MATKLISKYLGDDRVEITHGPTGEKIITDLPPDNGGKGRAFSPTDLAAASLSSCILTIMAVMARRDKINIDGAEIEIEKQMRETPRRIGEFTGKIKFPAGVSSVDRKKLMMVLKACPVTGSLHPDIKVELAEE
ncbi:MAG: osmotically inducible protein OsmC [Elusimicrobia bacterium CG08_land_8_20_14_0_20_51_18]|nr:MAG: osmotically inducible protein OsmC [Elusimicrobia bacterium CG08_land_8_20_14_0_20_51_18]